MGHLTDAAIARAVIAMAHSLKIDVVAEGVEDRHTMELLIEDGCDAAQGYYFSRPLPAAEFEQMLRAGRTLALPGLPDNGTHI